MKNKFLLKFFFIILFTISLSIPSISLASWTQQTSVGPLYLYNYTYSPDGTTLIAITGIKNDGYTYISTDNGVTWEQQTAIGSLFLENYTYSPDGNTLIATSGSDSYTYTSLDDGETWDQQTSVGPLCLYDYTYSPDGTYLIATSDNDGYTYISLDNGATWTEQTSVGPLYLFHYVYSPDGTTLIATSSNDGYTYISLDDGETWDQQTAVGPLYFYYYTYSPDGTSLIATSDNDEYTYISTDGGGDPVIFENGSGTEEDPYQISTCLDLQNINYSLNEGDIYPYLGGGYYFKLMNDIDCSDTINWNEGDGFEPIGNFTNMFIGNFDGDGYIVSDLYINRSGENYVGLFGYIENSVIENIGLEDLDITGLNYVGGLIGYSDLSHIENTYTTGDVIGSDYVGGLVGFDSGDVGIPSTIVNSYSTCNVSGSANTGGLIGVNSGDRVYNSFATGDIPLSDRGTSGFIGYLITVYDNTIFNSGWYQSEDNLDLVSIGGAGEVSHVTTTLSDFFSSSHPMYNGSEYPWVSSGSPWIFHTDRLPDFNEEDEEQEEIPVRRIRSSGSSASSRYINLLSVGNTEGANEVLNQFPNQINEVINSSTSPSIDKLTRTLKLIIPRMKGEDVKSLQTYLNSYGYDCGIVDGIFGIKTKQAVIKFQLANGLVGDGVVGPLTRAKLK